jgi:hypothetical protein
MYGTTSFSPITFSGTAVMNEASPQKTTTLTKYRRGIFSRSDNT